MQANSNALASFISPRYWPTWLGLGLLKALYYLPFPWQRFIGRQLGTLAYHLAKRRVHIARVNLTLCFPGNSNEQNEVLLKQHFQAFGMGLFESSMAWWGSSQRIRKFGQIEGLEHLQSALDAGRGVILVTGHFTSMELAGHILSAHLKIGAMYRPMKNRLMDEIVARARRRRLDPVFERSETRAMIKSLRSGHAIWYGFDQNYGIKQGVFARFFDNPAATITATSRFAKLGKADVIPFFPIRNSKGIYEIHVLPALEAFPQDDLKDAQRLNDLLQSYIIKAPEQYLWTHRRFKTRPEGYASVYD